MNNPKIIKAQIIVSCNVIIDDEILNNLRKETDLCLDINDTANRLLFAFLNPKIDVYNDEEAIDGEWDNICEFKGKFKKFEIDLLD